MGLAESARSVEGKIQRGTFRFTFFLQTLAAANNQSPVQWGRTLHLGETWEERATSVIGAELATQPWLDHVKLSRRLDEIGVKIGPDLLREQLTAGTFSTVLFFQCSIVCGSSNLQFFLDSRDLNDAAGASASTG
jgi:hypothetical protein